MGRFILGIVVSVAVLWVMLWVLGRFNLIPANKG